jgi:hypothetical protein
VIAISPLRSLACGRDQQKEKIMVIVWSNASYSGSDFSGTFYSNGGSVLVNLTGSAYSTSASSSVVVNLSIDGNPVGAINGFTNEAQSHKTLVPAVFSLQLSAGEHTATISVASPTMIDYNDYFTLVVTEVAPSPSE